LLISEVFSSLETSNVGESSHLDELDEVAVLAPPVTRLMGVATPPPAPPEETPMNFAVDESEGLLCSKVMRLRVNGLAAVCSTTKYG